MKVTQANVLSTGGRGVASPSSGQQSTTKRYEYATFEAVEYVPVSRQLKAANDALIAAPRDKLLVSVLTLDDGRQGVDSEEEGDEEASPRGDDTTRIHIPAHVNSLPHTHRLLEATPLQESRQPNTKRLVKSVNNLKNGPSAADDTMVRDLLCGQPTSCSGATLNLWCTAFGVVEKGTHL